MRDKRDVAIHIVASLLATYSLVTAFGMAFQYMFLSNVAGDETPRMLEMLTLYCTLGGLVYGILVVSYVFFLPKLSLWREAYLIIFSASLATLDFMGSNFIHWIRIGLPLNEWFELNRLYSISLTVAPAAFAILIAIEKMACLSRQMKQVK